MSKQSKINSDQAETNKGNDVSLKELFERVVVLETKLDGISETNTETRKQFRYLALLIIGVESINVLLNIILIMQWH